MGKPTIATTTATATTATSILKGTANGRVQKNTRSPLVLRSLHDLKNKSEEELMNLDYTIDFDELEDDEWLHILESRFGSKVANKIADRHIYGEEGNSDDEDDDEDNEDNEA